MLERLEPVRALAEGGEGRVVLARDPALGRWLAVKIVRLAPGARAVGEQLLARLAAHAREMLEPAVVPILASGLSTEAPAEFRRRFGMGDALALYVVMPYVHGLPAHELARGPLPTREAAALFLAGAKLLARLHAQGLVHLDLKPANVLVDVQGRVVLVDPLLGLVRGTGAYAAPETNERPAGGEGPGPEAAADRYALGRLVAAVWTGRYPESEREGMAALPEPALELAGKERLAHGKLRAQLERLAAPGGERAIDLAAAEAFVADLGGGRLAEAVAQSPFRGKLAEIEALQASAVPAGPGEAVPATSGLPRRWPLAAAVVIAAALGALWIGLRTGQPTSVLDTAAAPKAAAPPPASSCEFGEILAPNLVRFLCAGQEPRPGHASLCAQVEGPTGTTTVSMPRTGQTVWRLTSAPKGTTLCLELAAPHWYVFSTPTLRPDDPLTYPCGAQPGKHCGPYGINAGQEAAPPAPPESYAQVQRSDPDRLVDEPLVFPHFRAPAEIARSPLTLVSLDLDGPAAIAWDIGERPCDEPRMLVAPADITPEMPFELPEGASVWACPPPKPSGGPLKVHVQGYRPPKSAPPRPP
ncbi:MAG TPA: hypothetical protein VMB50_16420 [Myxococcales bacterium]|nr:hypothetical protein [Myxococcales bacterium]